MEVIRIETNQIWQEVDPRRERFIKVLEVKGDTATIQTVRNVGPTWERVPKTAMRLWANISRFNGKRGGYKLHQDVK